MSARDPLTPEPPEHDGRDWDEQLSRLLRDGSHIGGHIDAGSTWAGGRRRRTRRRVGAGVVLAAGAAAVAAFVVPAVVGHDVTDPSQMQPAATESATPQPTHTPTTTTSETEPTDGASTDGPDETTRTLAPNAGVAGPDDVIAQDPVGDVGAVSIDGRRFGLNDGFDRAVLDWSLSPASEAGSATPGVRAEYVDDPEDLPGDLNVVGAQEVLLITVSDADNLSGYYWTDEDLARIDDLEVVEGADLELDFEVEERFYLALGMAERHDFRLDTLQDPDRFAIDILHGEDTEG